MACEGGGQAGQGVHMGQVGVQARDRVTASTRRKRLLVLMVRMEQLNTTVAMDIVHVTRCTPLVEEVVVLVEVVRGRISARKSEAKEKVAWVFTFLHSM